MMNIESLPILMGSIEFPGQRNICDSTASAKPKLSFLELTHDSDSLVPSVSAPIEDHVALQQIYEKTSWKTFEAYTCRDAFVNLAREQPDVVLCDTNLPDGDWKDLLAVLSRRTNPPYLIVTSRLADEYMWAEVLNLGAYDLLMKPFDPVEIYRVVGSACQRHQQRNQREARS